MLEGLLEGCRKFRSWLINFEHLSSCSMNSDNAWSLFTTGGVEGHVIGISGWYEVDGSTSNTYNSQYSCSCCCGISWCKCALYVGSDMVNCSVTCLMVVKPLSIPVLLQAVKSSYNGNEAIEVLLKCDRMSERGGKHVQYKFRCDENV